MAKINPIDFQSLFNVLPGRYIVFLPDDPNFTIVAESDAHAEIGMVNRDDIIGKPLMEVFPDTSEQYTKTGKSQLIESLRKTIRTKKADIMNTLRYDLESPDGIMVERHWKVTHHPVLDEKGEVKLVFQATEDITDEISASSKLARTERQLREALSTGVIGTWMWDIEQNVVFGDEYMAAMFGVTHDEAIRGVPIETFINAIHIEDRDRIQKQIAKSMKSDEIYEVEYRTIDAEGSLRWIIARGRVERNDAGKPVKFPGVLIDNTERKQIESNHKFLASASTILSSSLDYKKTLKTIAQTAVPGLADWCTVDILEENGELTRVVVAHKDPSKIKWANQLNEKIGKPDMQAPTGVPNVIRTGEPEFYPHISEEMLKMSAKDDEHLELLKSVGFSSAIIVPLKTQDKTVGALTLITAEQKRHYNNTDLDMAMELAYRASLAMNNSHHYMVAQNEILERTRLEEELRIINEELERRIISRTLELNQTNLELERSNRELQDFAYVASHDLQEPLRKIQAFGNLLEEEYGSKLGEGSDYLNRMRSAAARMSALIEDILSFSRVTSRAREFTKTDLNELIREVLEDLETRIRDTGATVNVEKLPVIDADPSQMRQLFQNLIGNAIKFHKPDIAPIIKINAVTDISQPGKKKHVTVSFEDNGVGFDEKYLDRIFAVFQRLHSRDSYEGTGIGLAVCRKIVERHQGTITASSKPGKGSTFIVTLPIRHKRETTNE